VAKAQGQGLLLSNRASYAPYVMGAKRQSGLHRRRGWRRADQVLAEEAGRIEGDLVRAVEEVLK
jgi:hypothetical protein